MFPRPQKKKKKESLWRSRRQHSVRLSLMPLGCCEANQVQPVPLLPLKHDRDRTPDELLTFCVDKLEQLEQIYPDKRNLFFFFFLFLSQCLVYEQPLTCNLFYACVIMMPGILRFCIFFCCPCSATQMNQNIRNRSWGRSRGMMMLKNHRRRCGET